MEQTMQKTSTTILRIGLALVVIWFGIAQISSPTDWIGFLPTWITSLPISQLSVIYLNGWFELVFGTMLLFGVYTRFVALFLALHMLDITYTVGYGAIGVRDFGLAIGILSIFFGGMSAFSVDMFFATEESASHRNYQPMAQKPLQNNVQIPIHPQHFQ